MAGCLWLPRIVAKARLAKRGELDPEYAARFCHPTGVDGQFTAFFRLTKENLLAVCDSTDAEIAAWFRSLESASDARIQEWNHLAMNFGRAGFPMAERLPIGLATTYKYLSDRKLETVFAVLEADEGIAEGSARASGTTEAEGNTILETERLVLRQVIPSDAEFLFALMNEPAFHQNIGDRGIRTLDDARAYLEKRFTNRYAELGYGLYRVELKQDHTVVGISGFVKRDFLAHPDIGFAFLQKFWGRGYGFESGFAVMRFGQAALGFERVYGVTAPFNTGSVRLLEKLGLHFEMRFRMPEHHDDSLLFATVAKSPEQSPGTTSGPSFAT